CAACHGQKGEGIFGVELRSTALKEGKIRSAILRGKTRSGMPAFEGHLTDGQLEALVKFVTGLANGEIQPPPDTYLLLPAQLIRAPDQAPKTRGGN
ncbi:MAG: cytochrome c, partial [Chloroflexota bacterium]